MTLHFAYGSNMNRALMRARCPQAQALGLATVSGWRFFINRDGFASMARQGGGMVHGVLWKLSARDVAAINAYEDLDSGLYVRRMLPVALEQGCARSLVYLARRAGKGTPSPAYMRSIIAAAMDWGLPPDYVEAIARLAPAPRCRAERTTQALP